MNLLMPIPSWASQSSTVEPTAPDCEMKAMFPALGLRDLSLLQNYSVSSYLRKSAGYHDDIGNFLLHALSDDFQDNWRRHDDDRQVDFLRNLFHARIDLLVQNRSRVRIDGKKKAVKVLADKVFQDYVSQLLRVVARADDGDREG